MTWATRAVVLKQALPKLTVSDEWLSRVERSATEARAATVLERLLPAGSILAPIHVDERRSLFVMPSAPPQAVTWKSVLMAGRPVVNLSQDRRRAARLPALPESLRSGARAIFRRPPGLPRAARRSVLARDRGRRPHLARAINRHTERMLSVRECLVHGDYSPKNLLVDPEHPGAHLLDHEVCHWGDPTFDTAFCLTHLHLKACTFPDRTADFLDLVQVFWRAYVHTARPAPGVEGDTVGLLGCILAARVDGKSPAEYLTTDELRQRVRTLADVILLQDVTTLAGVRDIVLAPARR